VSSNEFTVGIGQEVLFFLALHFLYVQTRFLDADILLRLDLLDLFFFCCLLYLLSDLLFLDFSQRPTSLSVFARPQERTVFAGGLYFRSNL